MGKEERAWMIAERAGRVAAQHRLHTPGERNVYGVLLKEHGTGADDLMKDIGEVEREMRALKRAKLTTSR